MVPVHLEFQVDNHPETACILTWRIGLVYEVEELIVTEPAEEWNDDRAMGVPRVYDYRCIYSLAQDALRSPADQLSSAIIIASAMVEKSSISAALFNNHGPYCVILKKLSLCKREGRLLFSHLR